MELDRQHPRQRSPSARSLFPIAPPVNRLNVFRMVVSPCPSHAAGINMVRHNVAVICEPLLAESAKAILRNDLPFEELPHFTVGAEFPVPSGMMRIFRSAER